jgi:hypothetical protein
MAPPPGYGRGPAPRPRTARRRRRSLLRPITVGLLLVLTVVAAGWYFLGRDGGGSEQENLDFERVEGQMVSAARQLPEATAIVQEFNDLGQFDYAVDSNTRLIQNSMAELVTIVNEKRGEESRLAREAIANGEDMLRAIVRYREAITETNDLVDAQDALDDIAAEVNDLEARVKVWKQQ